MGDEVLAEDEAVKTTCYCHESVIRNLSNSRLKETYLASRRRITSSDPQDLTQDPRQKLKGLLGLCQESFLCLGNPRVIQLSTNLIILCVAQITLSVEFIALLDVSYKSQIMSKEVKLRVGEITQLVMLVL